MKINLFIGIILLFSFCFLTTCENQFVINLLPEKTVNTAQQLSAPVNLQIDEDTLELTWDVVPNASSYMVNISGEEFAANTNSYSLVDYITDLVTPNVYSVKVKAIGDGDKYLDSVWSLFQHIIPTPGLAYTLINDDTAYSVAKGTATDTNIIIPAVHSGLPVTMIAHSGFYFSSITSITISDSVTIINSWAFAGCTELTSIIIPNSVTSIGNDAFSRCTGLTSIIIPNSVTSIGWAAFFGCTGLTSMTVDSGNITFKSEDNCIIRISNNELVAGCKTSIIPASVTSIGNWAFGGCTGLTDITIPNSVSSIGWGAFSACTGLTSITIPGSVTSIGDFAFSECTSLTSIIIPNSVTSIRNSTFAHCTSLTNITIPDSVTSIDNDAFRNCTSLTSVTLGTISEENFDSSAFDGFLRYVYFSDGGGAGTYVTDNPGSNPTWSKELD